MTIQWFPGHMNKALRAIKDRMSLTDVVIEILDARIPLSSSGPLIESLAENKPVLKLLNKNDLADPNRTEVWLQSFKREKHLSFAVNAHDKDIRKLVEEAVRELAPNRGTIDKPLRALVCGVPNVGKSSIINTLIQKKSAKTGNEPGITKAEQRLMISDTVWLYDTPGMLWQKIILPQSGYRLAQVGSVGYKAYHSLEVVLELMDYLLQNYKEDFEKRYDIKLSDGDSNPHARDDATNQEMDNEDTQSMNWAVQEDESVKALEMIAKKRGAISKNGGLNLELAADLVLKDFRDGRLGRVTLETPEEFKAWQKSWLQHDKSKDENIQKLTLDGEEMDAQELIRQKSLGNRHERITEKKAQRQKQKKKNAETLSQKNRASSKSSTAKAHASKEIQIDKELQNLKIKGKNTALAKKVLSNTKAENQPRYKAKSGSSCKTNQCALAKLPKKARKKMR